MFSLSLYLIIIFNYVWNSECAADKASADLLPAHPHPPQVPILDDEQVVVM